MNKSIIALLISLVSASGAESIELMLTCTDTSRFMQIAREHFPSAGIDTYLFDPDLPSIRQSAGLHRNKTIESLTVTDADIYFIQAGDIQLPSIRQTFQIMISRADGRWVRMPRYIDGTGNRLFGTSLRELAITNGLSGFDSVITEPTTGECMKNQNKF